MNPLRSALAEVLGTGVAHLEAVAGGDVCQAYRAVSECGQPWFAKHHPREPPGMFVQEARGLEALRAAAGDALHIPAVRAVTPAGAPSAWLVLEWIEPGHTTAAAQRALGRGLATLHRASPPPIDPENWLGPFRQTNHPLPTADSWPEFWWSQRLVPHLAGATRLGHLSAALRLRFDRLHRRLPALLHIEEPMSLLHGDLWSGNRLTDVRGRPWLVDPAVTVGHREVDLAMMALFGGFGPACLSAYDDLWPRLPGHAERQAVYQLYYLLIHVEVFGPSYLQGLSDALTRAGV